MPTFARPRKKSETQKARPLLPKRFSLRGSRSPPRLTCCRTAERRSRAYRAMREPERVLAKTNLLGLPKRLRQQAVFATHASVRQYFSNFALRCHRRDYRSCHEFACACHRIDRCRRARRFLLIAL